MDGHVMETQYYERMDAALADKARIVPLLAPKGAASPQAVIELGSGSGKLAALVADQTGAQVFAVEPEDTAYEQLLMRTLDLRHNGGGIYPLKADADALAEVVPPQSMDAAIACSVLHEVYSYAPGGLFVKQAAWERTVASLASSLRPGGRLVIRDGVLPADPLDGAMLVLRQEGDFRLMHEYIDIVGSRELASGRLLTETHVPGVWEGTARAVAEAALTLNWMNADETGSDHLLREASETYMLGTLDGYAERVVAAAAAAGVQLRLVSSQAYAQDGYVRHMDERFGMSRRNDRSHLEPWIPDTNALWAFERL